MSNMIEEIARKLRETSKEYRNSTDLDPLYGAVIVTGEPELAEMVKVCGMKIIYAPTISGYTLGNVQWKIARFFEDV